MIEGGVPVDRSLSQERLLEIARGRRRAPFPPPCPEPGCGAKEGDWKCYKDRQQRKRHTSRTMLIGGGVKAVEAYNRGAGSAKALKKGQQIWNTEDHARRRSGKRKPPGKASLPLEQIDALMRLGINYDVPKSDPAHRLYNKRLGNLTPEEAKELLAALKRAAAAAS